MKNKIKKKKKKKRRKEPLIIGDYNLFEVGTLIFSSNVGSNCNFQPRCNSFN